jgi:catechol 2,3-dioxygenase-like lactoylglutathione lyase family enzyme
MARVVQLGHVGIYVRDLEKMVAFYRDFLGMQITKQNWERGMVFLSADPVASDHEIALMRGRPEHDDPHLINQISMRVETLDDLRDFHGRVVSGGYQIERVVNHGSAIGCYFKDPEGNTTEVSGAPRATAGCRRVIQSTCRSRMTSSWRRSMRRRTGAATCRSAGSARLRPRRLAPDDEGVTKVDRIDGMHRLLRGHPVRPAPDLCRRLAGMWRQPCSSA